MQGSFACIQGSFETADPAKSHPQACLCGQKSHLKSPILHQKSQNAATAPARNRLTRLSGSETPPNCRRFYDDLYQTQLSGCSAFPESRLQSLPHPYSPLRANTFLRISRHRAQASTLLRAGCRSSKVTESIYNTYTYAYIHISRRVLRWNMTASALANIFAELTVGRFRGEVGGWGRDTKKCTERDWGMGSSTI